LGFVFFSRVFGQIWWWLAGFGGGDKGICGKHVFLYKSCGYFGLLTSLIIRKKKIYGKTQTYHCTLLLKSGHVSHIQ
jgi:hypothetical protein